MLDAEELGEILYINYDLRQELSKDVREFVKAQEAWQATAASGAEPPPLPKVSLGVAVSHVPIPDMPSPDTSYLGDSIQQLPAQD